jgi:hypothetical protein
MFFYPSIAFKFDSFVSFESFVEGKHETSLMRLVTNLNSSIDHLTFECQINHIWAQAWDSNMKVKRYVIRDIFKTFV